MRKTEFFWAAVLSVALLLPTMSACSKEKVSVAEPENISSEETVSDSGDYLDVSGVDFSEPSITVAYDDYDGMETLSRKMQNYELEQDTVVEIDGEIGASMMSHSIVVPNADHSGRIGTTFEVVGMDDDDYPADGTRVHIVGVVRMNEYSVNVVVVPADQFKTEDKGATNSTATQSGEVYDAGTYTVLIPDGWVAIPNGDRLDLYKAASADDIFGANQISVRYEANGEYYLVTAVFDSYEEIAPITIGGRTWTGVEGNYGGGKYLMALNAEEGNGYISADVWLEVYGSVIAIDDADVQAILSSMTVK